MLQCFVIIFEKIQNKKMYLWDIISKIQQFTIYIFGAFHKCEHCSQRIDLICEHCSVAAVNKIL